MSTIPELTIVSWQALSNVAGTLLKGNVITGSPYIFRGHEDASWKLNPSLHRAITDDGRRLLPDAAEVLSIEQYLCDQFRAMAPNLLPTNMVLTSRADIDWWPIMRHYGVPTRLLDWTASIYVATYFAISRQSDKDGAVYLVHAATLERAMETTYGALAALPIADDDYRRTDAAPTVHLISRRTALPERIIAQQGGFMVCRSIVCNFEEILATEIPKVTRAETVTLRRLRIPAECKASFMRQLRAMNVTASSLFPGLDGIGRHLEETVRHRN